MLEQKQERNTNNMKVLQIITSLHTGGAEKLIVDMCPLLKERGHQVEVLLFDGTETPFKEELRKANIRIYQLSNGGFVYNPIFILKLISFLRKYDIIHTHNTACQYYTALANLFSFSKVSLVTTEHSTYNRRRNIWCFKMIDKFIYKQYRIIISISNKSTELLTTYLNRTKGIYTVLNGIDLIRFRNAVALDKKNFTYNSSPFLLTMVASFSEAKDQDTLIRAVSLLHGNYVLCLVGEGIRRSICEKLVKELNIEQKVIFAGFRNDIPEMLKTSDIIVLSSHWEGLSLSSLEGMSVGKPFIASDVDGLHEITEGAGILFSEGDAKQLAVEIQHLAEDKNYYSKIAEQCWKRVSQFNIQKTVDEYENLYQQCFYNNVY